MRIIKTTIPDVLIFEPKVYGDERGYFFESYRQNIFDEHVDKASFIQDNESFSGFGVLRGLHYQISPKTQGKLVRVMKGKVLDVAVDIRKGSPTFGKHVKQVLSEENKRLMWMPRGFAHGFIVLSENALFSYKCDNYYSPDHDAGIIWSDPQLGIDWGVSPEHIKVSEKDSRLPLLKDIEGIEV